MKWIGNCPFKIFNFIINCKFVSNSTESRIKGGCRANQHEANLMSTQNFAFSFIHLIFFFHLKNQQIILFYKVNLFPLIFHALSNYMCDEDMLAIINQIAKVIIKMD